MGARRRITLRDIAERCSVSPNTVSLALKNHPKISKATRDKIKEAAAALGYSPDPHLTRIMAQLNELRNKKETVSETVAYLECIHKEGQGPSNLSYFNGASEFLESHGYRVLVLHYDPCAQVIEAIKRKISNLGIRGVIIGPRHPELREVYLDWDKLVAVAISFHLDYPRVNHVDSDYYRHGRMCFEYLWTKGCRRIGLIMPGLLDNLHDNFHKSTYLGMAELYEMEAKIPILDINRKGTYRLQKEETIEWLKEHDIDGVLSWDEVPPVQREALNDVDPEIPLVLLRKNPDRHNESGILARSYEVGATAARDLVSALLLEAYGPPAHPTRTLIAGELDEASTS